MEREIQIYWEYWVFLNKCMRSRFSQKFMPFVKHCELWDRLMLNGTPFFTMALLFFKYRVYFMKVWSKE
jgi:hypothetical protein